MERPLKLAEGQRQTAQGHVALGAGIAQPPGFPRQVGRHGGKQVRLVEVERLAQLQPERASGKFVAGEPELEDRRGPAVEVAALGG